MGILGNTGSGIVEPVLIPTHTNLFILSNARSGAGSARAPLIKRREDVFGLLESTLISHPIKSHCCWAVVEAQTTTRPH